MAYSTNPATVENRLEDPVTGPGLQALQRGEQTNWSVTKDPLITQRVARQLREVLYLAARHPRRFPELSIAAERFVIKVVRDGYLEAVHKSTPKTEASTSNNTPIHGLEPQGKLVRVVGLVSAKDVKDSWQAHLPSSDPLHFTSVGLDEEEMYDLYQWAVSHEPRLMLLYDEDRATLTVSLVDPTVLEFAWTPAEVVVEAEERLDV
jgi:hypothetical protein